MGRLLDALEQAPHDRQPLRDGGLIHHSDRGVQYVSIRYTERLAEAGFEASVGSVGDSYDNALEETINGLYKAEVIHKQSWKNREAVEWATLTWVDWFNHRRLFGAMAISHPLRPKHAIINNKPSHPWRLDSKHTAFEIPGAIQSCRYWLSLRITRTKNCKRKFIF